MAYPDIATKEDLANEIARLSKEVAAAEEILTHADSITTAILDGGLLDRLPEGDENRAKHNAAVHLLSDLSARFAAYDSRPGTDPSISLHCLAQDVAKGRFAYKRDLESL